MKSQWYVIKLSVKRTLDDPSPHLLYLCKYNEEMVKNKIKTDVLNIRECVQQRL